MAAQDGCEDWLALTQLQAPTSVTAACVGTFSEVQPGVPLLVVACHNQVDVWQRGSEDDPGELRLLASKQLHDTVDHLAAVPGPTPGAPDVLLLAFLCGGFPEYEMMQLAAAADGVLSLCSCRAAEGESRSEKDRLPRQQHPLPFCALAPASSLWPGTAVCTAGRDARSASNTISVDLFCWEEGVMASSVLCDFLLETCEPWCRCRSGQMHQA